MLYRIFTEDKNTRRLHKLVSRYLDGYTSYTAVGFWKGTPEQSRVIEVVVPVYDEWFKDEDIRSLCHEIKGLNNQESVLLQKIEVQSEFI